MALETWSALQGLHFGDQEGNLKEPGRSHTGISSEEKNIATVRRVDPKIAASINCHHAR